MTDRMPAQTTTTDQWLARLHGEVVELRAELERAPVGIRQRLDAIADDVAALKAALPQPKTDPMDGETVELRGVAEQAVVSRLAAKPEPPTKPPAKKRTRS